MVTAQNIAVALRVGSQTKEWSKQETQGHAMDRICLIKKVISRGEIYSNLKTKFSYVCSIDSCVLIIHPYLLVFMFT